MSPGHFPLQRSGLFLPLPQTVFLEIISGCSEQISTDVLIMNLLVISGPLYGAGRDKFKTAVIVTHEDDLVIVQDCLPLIVLRRGIHFLPSSLCPIHPGPPLLPKLKVCLRTF